MTSRWRIQLLGGLRIERVIRDERQVITRLATRKTESLLAYLACQAGREPPAAALRESLVRLFWPESPPEHGRRSLSTALSCIRRELFDSDRQLLVSERLFVRLNPALVTSDTGDLERDLRQGGDLPAGSPERVRRLMEGIERYREPLLPGLADEWAAAERARLDGRVILALHELMAHFEHEGDAARAQACAARAVELDGLDEEARRCLMRAHAAQGETALALRCYQDLEQQLAAEVGAPPAEATRAAAEQIRLHGAGNGAPAPGGPGAPAAATVPDPSPPAAGSGGPGPGPEPTPAVRSTPGLLPKLTLLGGARTLVGAAVLAPAPLPVPPTRFFGRQREIDELLEALGPAPPAPDSSRLVTLTGPGGSGKTRLAIEVARILRDSSPVWYVSLADLSDPRLIGDRILQAVRPAARAEGTQLDVLAEALQPPEGSSAGLLVLDSFEHLIDAPGDSAAAPASEPDGHRDEGGALFVQRLLRQHPTLRCLLTSRQRLNVAGERELPVAPLPVPQGPAGEWGRTGPAPGPGATAAPDLVSLLENESIQLFVDRAQAVAPEFCINGDNAAAVAELCVRLEGIPLAVELAAARAQVLTPEQMLAQLERGSGFLVSRQRDVEARHRTLPAVVEWSYRLLPPPQQTLLARLSIFRHGWTLDAAEAICGDEPPVAGGPEPGGANLPTPGVLDCLEPLRDCSLVLSEQAGNSIRFRMLEMVREFAAERLPGSERERIERRHREYYLALAEQAESHVLGSGQAAWLEQLEAERANLWAALESYRSTGDVETSLRLAAALGWFWEIRGHYREPREFLNSLLESPASSTAGSRRHRARALNVAGALAAVQGDYGPARAHFEEALALARGLGDTGLTSRSLSHLGSVAFRQDDLQRARSLYEESLSLKWESGEQAGVAAILSRLGNVAYLQGEPEAARSYHEQSLAISRRQQEYRSTATSLDFLAFEARERGDLDAAWGFLEDGLALQQALGDRWGTAISLHQMALVARLRADRPQARRLLEESLAIRTDLGDRRGTGFALGDLGLLALDAGEVERAREFFTRSVTIRTALGERRAMVDQLDGLAALAIAEDAPALAAELLGAAETHRQAGGYVRWPSLMPQVERTGARAREALGDAAYEAASARGRALSLDEALSRALRGDDSGLRRPARWNSRPAPDRPLNAGR